MKNDNEKLIKLAGLISEKIGQESHPIGKVWDLKLSEIQKIIPMFFEEADNLLLVLKERGILNKLDNRYDKLEELSPDLLTPTKDADIIFSFEVNIPKLNKYIENPYTEFDEKLGNIIFGDNECPLQMHGQMFDFCRAMFKHKIGEWVSWDEIFELINKPVSKRDIANEKATKKIYDLMNLINQKVGECFKNGDLFEQEKNMFKRLF